MARARRIIMIGLMMNREIQCYHHVKKRQNDAGLKEVLQRHEKIEVMT